MGRHAGRELASMDIGQPTWQADLAVADRTPNGHIPPPGNLPVGMPGSGSMSPEHKWTSTYIKDTVSKASGEKTDKW